MVVLIDDIKKRELEIWNYVYQDGVRGIDFKTQEQINLLNIFNEYYSELPFTRVEKPNRRYHFNNEHYSSSDGCSVFNDPAL